MDMYLEMIGDVSNKTGPAQERLDKCELYWRCLEMSDTSLRIFRKLEMLDQSGNVSDVLGSLNKSERV